MKTHKPKKIKKCVISFATKDKNYPRGIARLEKTLKDIGYDGDFKSWIFDQKKFPKGCPSHIDYPYAFKNWAFNQIKNNYDIVIWMDTSIVPKNLARIFCIIEEKGYFLVKFGKSNIKVGESCSDEVLDKHGIDREESFNIPQLSSGFVGLNMQNKTARKFLKMWAEAAHDGVSFKGYSGKATAKKNEMYKKNTNNICSKDARVKRFRGQSVAAIIAYKLGMEIQPWDKTEMIVDRPYVKSNIIKGAATEKNNIKMIFDIMLDKQEKLLNSILKSFKKIIFLKSPLFKNTGRQP